MNCERAQVWKVSGICLQYYLNETNEYLGFVFIVCQLVLYKQLRNFNWGINQMTAVIITIGSILAIAGIGVSIWSIIDTRKRINTKKR